MKKYLHVSENIIITEEQLYKGYKQDIENKSIEENTSFQEYIENCLFPYGELEELTEERMKLKHKKDLIEALTNLDKAWTQCNYAFGSIYIDSNKYTCKNYPFNKSFDDIDVSEWIENSIEALEKDI